MPKKQQLHALPSLHFDARLTTYLKRETEAYLSQSPENHQQEIKKFKEILEKQKNS